MGAAGTAFVERQAVVLDRSQVRAARHEAELDLVRRGELCREVAANRACAEDADLHPARPSFAANPIRCSLPVAPLGISSRMTTFLGTLKSARRAATKSRMSRSLAAWPSRKTTAAATSSPSMACGIAKVIACATAG